MYDYSKCTINSDRHFILCGHYLGRDTTCEARAISQLKASSLDGKVNFEGLEAMEEVILFLGLFSYIFSFFDS